MNLKYLVLLVCGLMTTYQSFAQKHDYHFFQKVIPSESGMHAYYSDSLNDLVFESFVWNEGTVSRTPALSDKNGNLLCFSNNRYIYDSIGHVVINGDSIGVGWFQEYLMPMVPPEHKGLGFKQTAGFIPINDSLYYFFHKSSEILLSNPDYAVELYEKGNRINAYSDGLYLTKVRLNENGEIYILQNEKKLLIIDDLLELDQLIFCKHANGKDWWIFQQKILENDSYLIRLYEDGSLEFKENYSFSDKNGIFISEAPIVFNKLGDKIARLLYRKPSNLKHYLEIWNFDRCTGLVGDRIYYDSLNNVTYPGGGGDIEFSEDGNLLYIALSEHILQLDMDDIQASPDTIAKWDGDFGYGLPPLLGSMLRLPNGKIIVGSWVSTPFLHYIHEPNKKGIDCNFEQRALEMPLDPLNEPYRIDFEGFPSFPPYRMPALDIVCENATKEEEIIENNIVVYPNPTIGEITIDFLKDNFLKAKIGVYDLKGILHMEVQKTSYQKTIDIDTSTLPSGIYIVSIDHNNGKSIRKKIIVL